MPSPSERQVNSLDDADVHIRSLWVNVEQLAGRVRELEKVHDVQESSKRRLALFVLDGWPLRRVAARPQWRPWRRWFTS